MLLWVGWNLFLAAIPVACALALRQLVVTGRTRQVGGLLAAVGLAALWLAFLPNTCYLFTEWRHFFDHVEQHRPFLTWRRTGDLASFGELVAYSAFFLAFSGAGLATFYAAVRPLDQLLHGWRIRPLAWVALLGLCALGVYLGLILRYNSWDLVTRPSVVLQTIVRAVCRPDLLLVMAGFAAVLWALYQAVDVWVDGLRWRLTQR